MECPRISAQFLEEERRTMGDAVFTREYMCEFQADRDQLFPDEWLDTAEREEEE
jgi:hypothetical protein